MEIVRAMVRYLWRPTRFAVVNEELRIRLRELAEQRRRWGIGACIFCCSGKAGR